jgi:uncharacterized membrane protein (UPF0127 family)
MTPITVQNLTNQQRSTLKLRYCDSFLTRFIGLMFHPPLELDDGILLVGKNESRMDASIHMLFMRMDLTVLWLDAAFKVVDVVLARRWRPMYIPKSPAQYVMEISPLRYSEFKIGDRLHIEASSKSEQK